MSVPPSIILMVAPASALPARLILPLFVSDVFVVMSGAAGGLVSTVYEMAVVRAENVVDAAVEDDFTAS